MFAIGVKVIIRFLVTATLEATIQKIYAYLFSFLRGKNCTYFKTNLCLRIESTETYIFSSVFLGITLIPLVEDLQDRPRKSRCFYSVTYTK